MSTEHITAEIEAGLKAARKLKEKNDAERQRILSEQEKADQALVNDLEAAAALARATQQQHEDGNEERQHRLAQANRIAGVTPVVPDEPEPEPQAPEEPAVVDHDAAGNPPTAVTPVVPDEPEAPRRNNADPRNWRGIAWLLAIVGAVIGLIVARVTYDPMWSNVNNGFWHGLLVLLWFVALTAAGFFSGGWFGATREEERNNPPEA